MSKNADFAVFCILLGNISNHISKSLGNKVLGSFRYFWYSIGKVFDIQ